MSSFVINSKEFLKALQFAGKAVVANPVVPIMECVLIECFANGDMVITGSDLNTTIQTKTTFGSNLNEGESIKIAAPFDLLSKTLINLSNAPVTIAYIVNGEYDFVIELAYQNDTYVIPCQDPETYFKLPKMADTEVIKLPAQTLQRAIDSVAHCVCVDQNRPTMCGVCITIKNGTIEFVGVDGFILGVYGTDYHDNELDKQIIIPGKFASLMSEFIGDSDQEIEMEISSRNIKIQMPEWVAYGSLVDERFPDYQSQIPLTFKHEATIKTDVLKPALKRGIAFADHKEPRGRFHFKSGSIFLTTQFPEMNLKSEQEVWIVSDIEDFEIGFNIKYLSNLIKNVSGDFVFKASEFNRAAMIFPECGENESIKYLIMPVMLMTPQTA